MPEYRTSTPPAASRFGSVSKFLNIKRVFDDAVRQERWGRERDAASQVAERMKTAGTLATSSGMSGPELNQYVEQGQFPETMQGGDMGRNVGIVDPLTGDVTLSQSVPRGTKLYKGYGSEEGRLGYREKTKEQDIRFKARQGLNTYLSDANQVMVALNKIERESKNLGDFSRGLFGQTVAKTKIAVGSYAKDKNIARYEGVVAQELIPLARKLMEERGPITEWDVSRVEKGLGDKTLPLEDKLFLINEMKDKVKQAIKLKRSLASEDGAGAGVESMLSDEEAYQEFLKAVGQ